MRIDVPQGRTALYRFYDGEGRLLYVGIAANPPVRWKLHAREKTWWSSVARRDVEWFLTRPEAAAAEVAAIKAEAPAHNIEHSTLNARAEFERRPKVLTEPVAFAVPAQLKARFLAAVERSPDREANVSKAMRQFMRWYAGEPGAKLPERPGPAHRLAR